MTRPARVARPGTIGMSAVLLGGAGVLVAMAFLDWYDTPPGPDSVSVIRFHGLKISADRLDLPSLVTAYFDWLSWALLIALVVVGMVANAPSPAANALRAVGLVLGLAGIALTYYALQEIKSYGPHGTNAFDSADAGVWCALGGFAVAAIGAAIGPRRV